MIRLVHKVSMLLLLAVITITGSGCGRMYSEKKVQADGLEHLQKKYGEDAKFSIKSAYPDNGYYTMELSVEGNEDWEVIMEWWFDEREYYDNYISWVFNEEVEKIYIPLINSVYGRCKAYHRGGALSKSYNKETSIEEYLNTVDRIAFRLYLYQDIAEREERLEKFKQLLYDQGLPISMQIYYTSPQVWEEITFENSSEIASKRKFLLKCEFRSAGNYNGKYLEEYCSWREVEVY